MGSRTVIRFQRELAAGLKSGDNAIAIVQAVDAVATAKDLLLCLDFWSAAYDPTDWPAERQKKQRPQFETARTAGYLLSRRAIELATPSNGLAEMIQAMPKLASGQATKGAKEERYAGYARRYASLDDKTRRDIVRELNGYLKQRAEAASQKRLLIDSLAEAYRRQYPRPHKTIDELLAVKFDDPPRRQRFEKLAGLCEQAWTTTSRTQQKTVTTTEVISAVAKRDVVPMSDATSTSGKVDAVDRAFGAFIAWVEEDMLAPLDFFKLAAWIREASDELRVQTWKPVEFRRRIGASGWGNVWEELYLEAAARAQHMALSQWHIRPARAGRAFVGDDAAFIERPLGQRGKEVLRDRLALAAKDRSQFVAFNKGRRRAHIVAQQNGLNLLDEVEAVAALKQAERNWKKDPVGAAKRSIQGTVNRRPQKWWINQTIDDAFTILWIEAGSRYRGKSPGFVLVDVHAAPGFVFRAVSPFSGLSKLHQDAFFRQVARNAQIMAEGALALFELMGYVFDVATAVVGGGGIRLILFRVVMEILKDKATNAALDAAKIENPWVRTALGMAVNFVPTPKTRPPVRGIEESDFDAARMANGAGAAATARGDAVANPLGAVRPRAVAAPPKTAKLQPEPPPPVPGAPAKPAAPSAKDSLMLRQMRAEARLRTARPVNEPDISLPQAAATNEEAMVRLGTGTHGRTMATPDAPAGGTVTYDPSASRPPVRPDTRFAKGQEALSGKLSSTPSSGAARGINPASGGGGSGGGRRPPRNETIPFVSGGIRYKLTVTQEARAAYDAIPEGHVVVYNFVDDSGRIIYAGIAKKTDQRESLTRMKEHLAKQPGEFLGQANEFRIVGHYDSVELPHAANALEHSYVSTIGPDAFNRDLNTWPTYVDFAGSWRSRYARESRGLDDDVRVRDMPRERPLAGWEGNVPPKLARPIRFKLDFD